MNIVWKGSPNKDGQEYRKTIDRVVLHWFGIGDIESANSRFLNPNARVSAHYGISDVLVYQWVKENEVAWHAGNYPMNQRSIGIEHDATTIKNATEKTYQTAGQLLREVCERYNIPLDREHIIKHSEVSATQCPGTLDVDKIIAIAKGDSMSLTEDIGTEVEEQFKLKEIARYNKYWSYEELINDWVKLYSENVYNEAEKEKYKSESRALRQQVEALSELVSDLNTDIAEQDKKISALSFDLSQLQDTVSTISNEKIELSNQNKALQLRVESLDKENKDLYAKISASNPIEKYTVKELIVEIVDRFFKRG
jgi:N-acetylmuramoyl-L-alanine amidase CwlA